MSVSRAGHWRGAPHAGCFSVSHRFARPIVDSALCCARARVRNGFDETLYASVFYHLSKRTELYLAGDYMKLHGGYKVASTFGSNNRLELTTGIRTRF